MVGKERAPWDGGVDRSDNKTVCGVAQFILCTIWNLIFVTAELRLSCYCLGGQYLCNVEPFANKISSNNRDHYIDHYASMYICEYFGTPILFITFSCKKINRTVWSRRTLFLVPWNRKIAGERITFESNIIIKYLLHLVIFSDCTS